MSEKLFGRYGDNTVIYPGHGGTPRWEPKGRTWTSGASVAGRNSSRRGTADSRVNWIECVSDGPGSAVTTQHDDLGTADGSDSGVISVSPVAVEQEHLDLTYARPGPDACHDQPAARGSPAGGWRLPSGIVRT